MKMIRRAVALSTALVLALPAQAAYAKVQSTPEDSASFNGTVRAIAVKGSVIYVGGDFTSATDSEGTHRRRHLAAVSAVTGKVLPWRAHTNDTVHALALHKQRLYAGGTFTRVRGVKVGRLASLSTATGQVDRRYRPAVNGAVRTLAVTGKRLYLGGDFVKVRGKERVRLAALQRRSGALTSWTPRANRRVLTLEARGKSVYVGGWFTTINRKPSAAHLAALKAGSGGLRRAFAPNVDYPVMDLAVTKRKLFLAGAGAGGRLGVVKRSSGSALWHRTFDGDVQAVTVFGGVVYAGGHFDTMCASNNTEPPHADCVAGRVPTPRLAGFRAGGANVGWTPAADSNEGVLALHGVRSAGKLAVGGAFERFNRGAVRQPKFALFNE